jgi:hypothetical protein
LCNTDYPTISIEGEAIAKRVISSHLNIEPLFAFERSVSDERAYADMSDPGLIWIGRHDNAMGAGKGSSIRHLLPEEAKKLVRLLLKEPGQQVGAPSSHRQPAGLPLAHSSGQPINLLPTDSKGFVLREDELYFMITRQLFTDGSAFRRTLQNHLPRGITWEHIEYASSNFPWGYTAGAVDFVIFFRDSRGRRFIVIIECKKGRVHDETVLQVLLYAERTLQVAFLSAPSAAFPDDDDLVEILPVVIAEDATRPRTGEQRIAIPLSYELRRSYCGGATVKALVRSPLFLRYVPPVASESNNDEYRLLEGFEFQALSLARTMSIQWQPEPGAVGTSVEKEHLLRTSWAEAKTREAN